jgi:hypothetical protein
MVDNFGGTSLAWASMGIQAHRLDFEGPHAGSRRLDFGGLEDTLDDLTIPSQVKRLVLEATNVTLRDLASCLRGFEW